MKCIKWEMQHTISKSKMMGLTSHAWKKYENQTNEYMILHTLQFWE